VTRSSKSWCAITSNVERILAVDVGSVRWGVAVSDELGVLAHPLATLAAASDPVPALERLIRESGATRVVLGWPRRTDGRDEGRRGVAAAVGRLAERLRRDTGLPIDLWDERLTTAAAERILRDRDLPRRERRRLRDQVAAQLILQSYLDARRSRGEGGEVDDRKDGSS
jgi:putative Holliday junction resolvase